MVIELVIIHSGSVNIWFREAIKDENILEKTITDWMGENSRIDDILLTGGRVKFIPYLDGLLKTITSGPKDYHKSKRLVPAYLITHSV